jgi:hypothetical protein
MISLPLQEAADLVDIRLRAGDHACEVVVDLADGPVIPITASLDKGLVDQGRLVLGGGEGSHLALSSRGRENSGRFGNAQQWDVLGSKERPCVWPESRCQRARAWEPPQEKGQGEWPEGLVGQGSARAGEDPIRQA